MADNLFNIGQNMPHLDEERKHRLNYLAYFVAVLPWFNVEILHKLYFNVFRNIEALGIEEVSLPKVKIENSKASFEARAITCADFLHTPYVQRIGYNSFMLEDEAKARLRNKLNAHPHIIDWIGEFMLSLSQQSKENFPNASYREVYKMAGLSIVQPQNAILEISQHIIQQIYQKKRSVEKQEALSYYINLLERKSADYAFKDLKKLLEAYQCLMEDKEEEALEKLKTVRDAQQTKGDSIKVKLNKNVQQGVLESLEKDRINTSLDQAAQYVCFVETGKVNPEMGFYWGEDTCLQPIDFFLPKKAREIAPLFLI